MAFSLFKIVLLVVTIVNVTTENPAEDDYVLAFPREGFTLPLYDWDPQHRKHIANGWVDGRSPWNYFEGDLPPRPPKDRDLPQFSPSPSPSPFTQHPSPSPTGSEEELCIPSPDCVEPHTGPVSGGVRVTIQGDFLSRSLEDIQEIRLCGVRVSSYRHSNATIHSNASTGTLCGRTTLAIQRKMLGVEIWNSNIRFLRDVALLVRELTREQQG